MNYVLVGYYSDLSGFYLLGVYDDASQARDRLKIALSAQPVLTVKCFPMYENEAQLVNVCQDDGFTSGKEAK